MTSTSPLAQFLHWLDISLAESHCLGLTLSAYRGTEPELKKLLIKPVLIKQQLHLSFTWRYARRDVVKNHLPEQARHQIAALVPDFGSATLFTPDADWQLENKPGKAARLQKHPASKSGDRDFRHDRTKARPLQEHNTHWMQALKLSDAQGKVFKHAQDKFRQINRYVELMQPLLANVSATPLRIVDMGAGKGYLTFALYQHLLNQERDAQILGIEARPDLVTLCNQVAADSNYTGLHFEAGHIGDKADLHANVVIALHACDTATDDAIAQGLRCNAELIVVAPCCHKQIRREMEAANVTHPLEFVTRHGIFLEREAEMITDALRCLLLERAGYKTRAFEFVSDAHTAKNVMLVAEKRKAPMTETEVDALSQKIDAAKAMFGIGGHYLEGLLTG